MFPHVGHVVENSWARCRCDGDDRIAAVGHRHAVVVVAHQALGAADLAEDPALQIVRDVAVGARPSIELLEIGAVRPVHDAEVAVRRSSSSACRGSRAATAGDRTPRCRCGTRSPRRSADSPVGISSPAAKYVTARPSIVERFTIRGPSVPSRMECRARYSDSFAPGNVCGSRLSRGTSARRMTPSLPANRWATSGSVVTDTIDRSPLTSEMSWLNALCAST